MAVTKIEGPERMAVQGLPSTYIPQTGDMWALLSRTLQERKALALRERERQDQFELLEKGHQNELARMDKAAGINRTAADEAMVRQKDILKYGHDLDEASRTKQLEDATFGAGIRREAQSMTGQSFGPGSTDDALKLVLEAHEKVRDAQTASTLKRNKSTYEEIRKFRSGEALAQNMSALASNALIAKAIEAKKLGPEAVIKTVVLKGQEAQRALQNFQTVTQTAIAAGNGAAAGLAEAANRESASVSSKLGAMLPDPQGKFGPSGVGAGSNFLGAVAQSRSPQDRNDRTWRLLEENAFARYGDDRYTKLGKLVFDAVNSGRTVEDLAQDKQYAAIFNEVNGDAVHALRGYVVGLLSQLRSTSKIPNASLPPGTEATSQPVGQDIRINDPELRRDMDSTLTRMSALLTKPSSFTAERYARDYENSKKMLELGRTHFQSEDLVNVYLKGQTIKELTEAYANAQLTDFKDDPAFVQLMSTVPPETRERAMSQGATIAQILSDAEVKKSIGEDFERMGANAATDLTNVMASGKADESAVQNTARSIEQGTFGEELDTTLPDFPDLVGLLDEHGVDAATSAMDARRPPTLLGTLTHDVLSGDGSQSFMEDGFDFADVFSGNTFPNLTPYRIQSNAAKNAKAMVEAAKAPPQVAPQPVGAPQGQPSGPAPVQGGSPQGQPPRPPQPSPLGAGSKPMMPLPAPHKVGGQGMPPAPNMPQPPQPPTPTPPPAPAQPNWGGLEGIPGPAPSTQPFWR